MSISKAVKMAMLEHDDFRIRPMAYANRDKLFLVVCNKLGRRVSPESVTRQQRKVWHDMIYLEGWFDG